MASRSATPFWRTFLVGALVCASALLLVAGGTLVYAQRELLDTGRFADRLTGALHDRDVRAVFAQRVTAAVEAGHTDLASARPVIRSAAMAVAGSAPFAAAVRSAAVELHVSVFDQSRGTARLQVADVGVLLTEVIRRRQPALVSRLPASISTRIVSLATLRSTATSAARRVKRLVALGPWALLAAALSMAAVLLLARSRRRGVAAVSLAVAAAGGAAAAALLVARAVVVSRVAHGAGQDQAAAGAVWDAYLGGLLDWCLAALAAGLIVTAAATVRRPRHRGRQL
jgi:hypothetical protein